VVASTGAVTVSFTPPLSNGGLAIGYIATANPGGRLAGASTSPIKIVGLSPGETYTVTVVAKNSKGVGPASASSDPVTLPKPEMVLLTLADARTGDTPGQFIDVATGYLFNPADGSEKLVSDLMIGGNSPPPLSVVLDPDSLFIAYDRATHLYYTYRASTVDIPTQSEILYDDVPSSLVDRAVFLITKDLKVVDVFGGNYTSDGTNHWGILLDAATLEPIDGTVVAFEPLEIPLTYRFAIP
jgi:hypothetical protein